MITSSRIPLLSKEEALQRGRELGISDYIAQMNIFRVLLNHPKLAGELNSTIISLVNGDKAVSDRLREIIIMRVSWKAYCDYEWSQHWMASLFLTVPAVGKYSKVGSPFLKLAVTQFIPSTRADVLVDRLP